MPGHVDEIFLDTNGPQNNLRTSHHMELKERSVGRSVARRSPAFQTPASRSFVRRRKILRPQF